MPKIVIDPGHGGVDPGAVGPRGTKESDITLSVSELAANDLAPVAEVKLTRTEDVALASGNEDLYARCRVSNEFGANVFVSIHANSAADQRAHGTEVYCYPGSTEGRRLAQCIHDRLIAATGLTDRGVKEARFAVIGPRTSTPAALVEVAFISNPAEEELLLNAEFRAKAACAIAEGTADYFGICLRSEVQPVPSPEINSQVDQDAVKIRVGSITLNGKLIDGLSYAPVRALAEALGRQVGWNGETRTVIIE